MAEKICLYEVNEALKVATGKDLLSQVINMAYDPKMTELEVKQFLKENYPWEEAKTREESRLAADHVNAYLAAYQEKVDGIEESPEVTYASGCCECCLHEEREKYRSKNMVVQGETVGGFFD